MNAGRCHSLVKADNQIFTDELREVTLSSKNVLLSAEDIGDLSESSMKSLRVFLGARAREIKAFALVRSPYSLHCSAYSAMVTHGGRCIDPSKLLSQKQKIEKIKRVFGNLVCFYPFRSALEFPGGPTAFLLNVVDSEMSTKNFRFINANQGPTNVQTRAQAIFNQIHQKIQGGSPNPEWKRVKSIGQEKFLLTSQELDALRGQLERENEFLRSVLGEQFCDHLYPVSPPVERARLEAIIRDMQAGKN